MKAEIDNFIGVFDDVVTKEYCDYLINFFESMRNIGKTVSRKKFENVSSTIKDNTVYYVMNETDPLIIDSVSQHLAPFTEGIETCYNLYTEQYGTIRDLGNHALNPDIKMQKTLPKEGYHVWHCETADISTSRRLLLCMLYLNDVHDGGETEFLYQSKRINPVAGRVVINPAAFTHAHRGNPPLKTAKYMINGWMEFINFHPFDN